MEFEPTFSPENKKERNEKEVIKELRKEGERSEELKALIEEKWKDHKEDLKNEEDLIEDVNEREPTPEEIEEDIEKQKTDVYNRYMEDFNLAEEDLEGKSILDLGCGKIAPFIQKLKEKDLDVELKGIDIDLNKDHIPQELGEVIECGNFEKKIPEGSYDYVLAYGSIFAFEVRDPESAILNAVESLNPGGEVKITPINEPIEGDLVAMEEEWDKMNRVLEKVAKKNNLQLKMEEVDFRVSGKDKNNKDIWIKNLATLKRVNINN